MEKTKINTIDIRGKKYATVDSRVEFFREKFPTWSLETEYPVLDLERGVCVCRAVVKDEVGRVVAQGTAHEWQSKPGSMVNKTSFVENCETSAVGRALGFLGIGINGLGIATAEEVSAACNHADANDSAPNVPPAPQTINDVVGDEIPAMFPGATIVPTTTRTAAHPDDWMTPAAFGGVAAKINSVPELQDLLNAQRGNPNIKKLAEIASARKAEIIATMGA